MSANRLSKIWESVADRGREIVAARRGARLWRDLEHLCRDLLAEPGEASASAMAREVVERYEALERNLTLPFFTMLLEEFSADVDTVNRAADAYRAAPDPEHLLELSRAVEAPRQELLRRLNMAPHGTAAIVAMRKDLLRLVPKHPELRSVDADFEHLLRSWFNRGFLELHRIDWNTPAVLLEKLFKYEAVHAIRDWSDMHRRLEADRRCFAFFHPALPQEPLIFVEVALLDGLAESIEPLLDSTSVPGDPSGANTAVFYSISTCQDGLRGISFGSFLIKQVVTELAEELPRLRTFATLSPVPGLRKWLTNDTAQETAGLTFEEIELLSLLKRTTWHRDDVKAESLKELLLWSCARYLLEAKAEDRPLDPVARFHLGNGASIERINWLADTSAKGLRQSAGLMVNYVYRPWRIERNHEAYVSRGNVSASKVVRALARRKSKS
ncbi:MAG: malonyl-CoA decarboxylase [Acidobacteriota bacterium]|nr:malonyl-CoA decarboxylase [Acidobacteriota bacterium]